MLSKIDMVETEEEVNEIISFVKTNVHKFFGIKTQVFPVSSKLALKCKKSQKKNGKDWDNSRFEILENYILNTLGSTEKLNLKLQSPLGLSSHIVSKYLTIVNNRLSVLQRDESAIQNVENQLNTYIEEIKKGDLNFANFFF